MKNNLRSRQFYNEEHRGDFHSLHYTDMPMRQYRLFIDEFGAQGSELHGIYNTLLNSGPYDTLELRIGSYGGLISELQQFQNIIENVFYDRTITVLDPHGMSCGAMIFCLGNQRIVHKHSRIMFHDYSGGAGGKGSEIEAQVVHNSSYFRELFRDIIKDFMTPEEIDLMIVGKDYYFNTEEMCRRGIATHVIVDGESIEAEEYLKLLYPEPEKPKRVTRKRKTKKEDNSNDSNTEKPTDNEDDLDVKPKRTRKNQKST